VQVTAGAWSRDRLVHVQLALVTGSVGATSSDDDVTHGPEVAEKSISGFGSSSVDAG